jgi:hypothetical protein
MAARLGLVCLLAVTLPNVWGCATWSSAPRLPDRNSLVLDQLVITSDAPLPAQHRLLEELRLQRSQLSTKLALPLSDEPIHVYLFSSSDNLAAFMRVQFPDVPQRRAFFVETDTRLSVYAYWGDRVAEDLRHEVAHGYLHAVVPRLPLWLDEGLAEYFEVPRGMDGVNRPHVERLLAEMAHGWRPNLQRLESLEATGELKQTDYAESWAWVSLLLDSNPQRRAMLQAYLQSLRQPQPVAPLSQQVQAQIPSAEQQLLDYLGTLHHTLR